MLVFGLKTERELRVHHLSMFAENLMMQSIGNMVARLFVEYPAVATVKIVVKYVRGEDGRLAVDGKIRRWLEENKMHICGVGYEPASKQQVALFAIHRDRANYEDIRVSPRLKNDGKTGSMIFLDLAIVLSNEFPKEDKVQTSTMTMLAEMDDETSIQEVEKIDLRGPTLVALINYSMLSSKWRQAEFKLNDLDISLKDIVLHKDSVAKFKVRGL